LTVAKFLNLKVLYKMEGPGTNAKPFLKWAGGKTSLLKEILPLVPSLDNGGCYWEPFLGGASVFFSINPKKAVLSDLNCKLIKCYSDVRNHPEEVFDYLAYHSKCHSSEHYQRVRHDFNGNDEGVAQSARFIYINKACFNGIYRENRNGNFNVPYGKKKKPALPTLQELIDISKVLQKAVLTACTFQDLIGQIGKGDFVYLDPPYTVMHDNNGFIKYNAKLFSWEDQQNILGLIKQLSAQGTKVLISNAAHYSIKELYRDFDIIEVSRASCVSADKFKRSRVAEYLIKNY